MTQVVQRADEAARAVEANTTPRMRRLSLLRAYVRGDQYSGRPKWHCKDVPVWEREPCVIWGAVAGAITSNEDLLLGDGRYPVVTSRPEEDDGDEDEELDEDASEAIDRLIRHIEKEAELRAHTREQYCNAQSVGSIVGVFGARNGKLFADTVDAEFCTPTFDAKLELVELEIKYPYVDVTKDRDGKWVAKAKFFRRVIDRNRDVTFLPGEARADGIEPEWKEDASKSVDHGLGFCPCLYRKFRSVSTVVNETDGHAAHERVLDELDAFNIEASVRHDGAVYSLPQKYETGVDPGYNPTGDAVVQPIPQTARGGRVDPIDNPQTGHYLSAKSPGSIPMGARKQGPGYTWQYPNPETKVGQLELNDGALQALADTMADLRARVCEALAWVPLNPEEIKFAAALSGKALERLMARQLNRVAKDRDGFGKEYLLTAYCILLRIAQKLGAGIKTRGLKKAKPYLDSFVVGAEWSDPPLTLRWGSWFQPLPEDDKALVEMTTSAYEARFITKETAVQKLARTFGIEDVAAYLEGLEEEAEKRKQEDADADADAIAAAHRKLTGDPTKLGTGAGNAKPPVGGRSGGAGAVAAGPQKASPKS